jgi:hypothetical protein
MSSCLNLAKTVKQASAELLFVQFAAGCKNVGVTSIYEVERSACSGEEKAVLEILEVDGRQNNRI